METETLRHISSCLIKITELVDQIEKNTRFRRRDAWIILFIDKLLLIVIMAFFMKRAESWLDRFIEYIADDDRDNGSQDFTSGNYNYQIFASI